MTGERHYVTYTLSAVDVDSQPKPNEALQNLHTDACLTQALSFGFGILASLPEQLAHSLAELGDISLPDAAPTPSELSQLNVVAPLYLAFEMETVGLLRTADRVSALFASGAITQPLGEIAEHITRYWRTRHERLGEQERVHLLNQIFAPTEFYPQFLPFCEAVMAMADNRNRRVIFEEVALQVATRQLRETLFPRLQGMLQFAAGELLQNVQDALRFLRERNLLFAFNARSLWHLLSLEGRLSDSDIRQHVDMANAGQLLLSWLAQGHSGSAAHSPNLDASIFAAAQRWMLAYQALSLSHQPSLQPTHPSTPAIDLPAYG